MAVLNLFGAALVAKAQSLIVWVLLAVFAGFALVTLVQIDSDLLALLDLSVASGHDHRIGRADVLRVPRLLGHHLHRGRPPDPARTLPRAMYLALGITALVYVAVSLGVFGTLTVDEVIGTARPRSPRRRRPVLGDAGFTIMAIAALLATASSVNSNILRPGTSRSRCRSSTQFPPIFGEPGRYRGTRGVIDHGGARPRPLQPLRPEAIASVGSAVSLTVFLVVGARRAPAARGDGLGGVA